MKRNTTCLFYGLFYDFVNRQVLSTPILLPEFLSETASFLELEHELCGLPHTVILLWSSRGESIYFPV